jgi:hypothetical protein
MANAVYDDARNNILGNGTHGQTDWDTDNLRFILYDEGADALNLADVDLADILSAAREATSANLTSQTVGAAGTGAFDHADETLSAVSGTTVESITYYEWSAVESTSPLLLNLDSWTGLPLTPNGADVIVAPHVNGVFQITGA